MKIKDSLRAALALFVGILIGIPLITSGMEADGTPMNRGFIAAGTYKPPPPLIPAIMNSIPPDARPSTKVSAPKAPAPKPVAKVVKKK